MRRVLDLLACTLALTAIACGDATDVAVSMVDDTETPPLDEDLVAPSGGKEDTGYLSNLATEVEGTFGSSVYADSTVFAEDPAEAVERAWENEWRLRSLVDMQLKFAKNQINASALHLNLSSTDLQVTSIELLEGDRIRIEYTVSVESIVTQVELDERGLDLADVLGARYDARVPDDPSQMAERVGAACLEEGHEAADYNYFYYYAPDRAGCAEAMDAAGLSFVDAELSVRSLAPSKTVYPEYDRLTEDGRIDVVVFFGAADHDWEPGQFDWGAYGRDTFVRDLQSRGFRKQAATDSGDVWTRTASGLREQVTVVGPEVLKLLREDTDGLFSRLVGENEIIFYNGHSFYGSLSVLDDPSIYAGRYQIFFMNSCWSYEYYTKQVFKNKATDEDPNGWGGADVVNDTESGWFHNMAGESRILLSNLLRGAETGGVEGERFYTWDRIIGAMNAHAKESYESRNTATHEIYGVSGVRTNAYQPARD